MSPLVVVFLTVFIDLLGFGIIIPLLPFYAESFGATGLTVGLGMTCRKGFTATGQINLVDARLGYLDMSGAQLSHPGDDALDCRGEGIGVLFVGKLGEGVIGDDEPG